MPSRTVGRAHLGQAGAQRVLALSLTRLPRLLRQTALTVLVRDCDGTTREGQPPRVRRVRHMRRACVVVLLVLVLMPRLLTPLAGGEHAGQHRQHGGLAAYGGYGRTAPAPSVALVASGGVTWSSVAPGTARALAGHGGAAVTATGDALPSCPVGLGPLSIDPCLWAMQAILGAVGWVIDATVTGFAESIITPIDQADIFTGTPHALTDQNPAVENMTSLMQIVALTALVLVVCLAGFTLMLGPHAGLTYYEVRQFLPRLVLGGIGSVTILWLCGQFIDLSNVLCSVAVTNSFLPVAVPDLSSLGNGSNPVIATLLLAFTVLGYTLFALLDLIQILVRLALLDILLPLGPLAMACWILPQTQRWAERWTSLFAGVVVAQPLQLVTISIGLGVATSLPGNSELAGLFGQIDLALIEGLMCLGAYYLAFKIPGFLTRLAAGGSTAGAAITGALVGGNLLRTGMLIANLV